MSTLNKTAAVLIPLIAVTSALFFGEAPTSERESSSNPRSARTAPSGPEAQAQRAGPERQHPHAHAHVHPHAAGYDHHDDGHHHVRDAAAEPKLSILKLNTQPLLLLQSDESEAPAAKKPDAARHFSHFGGVKTRWDAGTLFVESNGLPDHGMMVGIRSWQQQVPLPQPFTGKNAWQIPLQPKLAEKPISAKTNLFRGAIALAVNGVPIFNALNNRGEDAYLAGELDTWGGHCGRGDDYHYHVAPVHLEKIVGRGQPIAYALDGFPIYGLTEADGKSVGKLDEFNGQFDAQGRYHYHATKTYPYINGGMRGVVTVRGGQLEPQPRDSPLRPALRPLPGAVITEFKAGKTRSVLKYRVQGKTGSVTYGPTTQDSWEFTFKEPSGESRTETYQRGARRRERPEGGRRPPPPPGPRPPRRD